MVVDKLLFCALPHVEVTRNEYYPVTARGGEEMMCVTGKVMAHGYTPVMFLLAATLVFCLDL